MENFFQGSFIVVLSRLVLRLCMLRGKQFKMNKYKIINTIHITHLYMHFKMVNGPNRFIIKFFCPMKCSLEYPSPLIINIQWVLKPSIIEDSLILRRTVPLRALEPRPVRTSLMRGWMMGDSATNGR